MRTRKFILTLLLIGAGFDTGCSLRKSEQVNETLGFEERRSDMAEKARPAPPAKISADTHLAAGRMLEKQGDLMAAVSQYERAIAAEPRVATGYSRLGVVYQKLGQFEDADNIFRRGIQSDPGSAMLRNNLGYSYLLQKRYADAEKQFRDALGIAPDFQRSRMNLAIALGYQGRSGEALDEFSAVVPQDMAHFNLAVLEMELGDYHAARNSLQLALAINPECAGAREQLQRADALAAGTAPRPAQSSLTTQTPLAGSPTEENAGGP